jgi:hypothetical protein
MKIKNKRALTFGDLVKAAYQVCGAAQAEMMVRLAVRTRLVVCRSQPQIRISSAEGKSHE